MVGEISEEDFLMRKREAYRKEHGGTMFCAHDWVELESEQEFTIQYERAFGKSTRYGWIKPLYGCIKCGKTKRFCQDIGGGCFIATASYGSPLAPQLDVLRRFRDACLPSLLVHCYYKTSPPIAEFISSQSKLRRIICGFLEPLVKLLKWRQK